MTRRAKNAEAHPDVRIVPIPNITPDGKAGLDDLLACDFGEKLFGSLVDAAQPFSQTPVGRTLAIQCIGDVEAGAVPWLWEGYLAFGMLAMLSGDPSAGKTFIALAVAASFSLGRVPITNKRCQAISTLILSHENSPKYVIRPRWDVLGGDKRRLFIFNGAVGADGVHVDVNMQSIDLLRAALIETGAKLLIIDPIQSFLGADVDSHRSNETRPVMDGLGRLAEELGVCVLIIRHLAKSSGGRAIHRGLGSIDLTGAVRIEMLAGTDADDPQHRALIPVKCNLGKLAASQSYSIKGEDANVKFEWSGPSTLTAADLFAAETGSMKRTTQIEGAEQYLRKALANGPKLFTELDNGEHPSKVLQKASTALGLKKSRNGESGPWKWALPKFGQKADVKGGEMEA